MNPAEFIHLAAHEERFWWFRGMRRIVDELLDKYCHAGPGDRILEAGCGTGFEAARLAGIRRWNIVPIDLADTGVRSAQRRGLHPAAADIEALPFAEGSFAGLFSLDVIVHLEEAGQASAIREFARVLRPGGWLLIRAAALDILRSRHSEWAGERQRVTLSRMRGQVEAAGLKIKYATYANSLLLPVALAKFRVWEPLVGARPASGVELPASWLNQMLEWPLRAECAWIRGGGRFPVGQSAYVVAEKPA